MLEAILGIQILEFIVSIMLLVNFGPTTAKKVKSWGDPRRWFH